MTSSEIDILCISRHYFDTGEVEKFAGLLHLRHHRRQTVRIAANEELIEMLDELNRRMDVKNKLRN